MKRKESIIPSRTCANCIHEYACEAWNCGTIHNADATNCINYETVRDSAAYSIGKHEAEPVIRCKDCKYCKSYVYKFSNTRVISCTRTRLYDPVIRENDYCSHAIRKEEEAS